MMADALVTMGKFADASVLFRQAQAVFDRSLGSENPENLLNRSSLALALAEHQDFETAEKELKAVLAIRERLLGANHVSVLMTCYHLGRVLGGHHQFAEADVYARRANTGFSAIFGPTNDSVVKSARLCREIEADIEQQSLKDAAPKKDAALKKTDSVQ
jgi:tetratricopeptide (TPR) repeat protein